MPDLTQRWRSLYCMTSGATCRLCYSAGVRGGAEILIKPEETDPRYRSRTSYVQWGSGRWNALRRRRALAHLKAMHPAELPVFFPTHA